MARLGLKRVYEAAVADDGRRYLVDRLWPRGMTKERARLSGWLKEAAPSPELRKWYDHSPDRWEEFRRRYFAELRERPQIIRFIKEEAEKGQVTLVFAAKVEEYSHARALKEFLDEGGGAS